ncbi:MAG TPA: hypothetical protein DGG95_06040 [Cytophagales bacterium]|nr:hypothetical protein [Cytophagales bacterium]
MPLTEKVTFTAALQSANTLQVPKLIRWQFKLDSNQTLKLGVNFVVLHKGWQFFYKKMCKDGRITLPKLVLSRFMGEQVNAAGFVLEIMLEPA